MSMISEIEPWLYLGGIPSPNSHIFSPETSPHKYIYEFNLSGVISLNGEYVDWNLPVPHLFITIPDQPNANIYQYFNQCIDFMDNVRKNNGRILVHCQMGISRSATIVAAYYIKHGLPSALPAEPTVDEVLHFIRTKRPQINPNFGFIEQLHRFYRECHPLIR